MDISLLEETIMLYTETKELQKYRDKKKKIENISKNTDIIWKNLVSYRMRMNLRIWIFLINSRMRW